MRSERVFLVLRERSQKKPVSIAVVVENKSTMTLISNARKCLDGPSQVNRLRVVENHRQREKGN